MEASQTSYPCMEELANFNAINWLHSCMPQLNEDNYAKFEPLFSFLLIWNLFERIVCNKHARFQDIKKHVKKACDQQEVNRDNFDSLLRFFQVRYTKEQSVELLGESLLSHCKEDDCKGLQLLKSVLLGDDESLPHILQSLLFIAYRVRNNLFHGEKELNYVDKQLSLFAAVNAMLCRYMELSESYELQKLRVSIDLSNNARR